MMQEFYVACGADTPDGGIYRCRIGADGKPVIVDFRALRRAGYFAFSPDKQTLYCTGTAAGAEEGGAAAFRIAGGGGLQYLNAVATDTGGSCHLDTTPDGRFLYTANYHSGSFSEIPLAADGSLAGPGRCIRHSGSGPCGDRQSRPHVHYTGVSPDGRFLCVTDLGTDSVICYPLHPDGVDAGAGIRLAVDPGGGPRHLTFARDGRRCWLVNEMGNTIWSLVLTDGRLTLLDRVSTLADGWPDPFAKAAAIRLDASGRYLFVSNRGPDNVVCFRLDGDLLPRGGHWCSSGGCFPRDILLLPDGRTMIAANEISGNLAVLAFDPVAGELHFTGTVLALPRPIGLIARS